MDFSQGLTGFPAVAILFFLREGFHDCLRFHTVDPALNGINPFFTKTEIQRLTHGHAQSSSLFHVEKLSFLTLILGGMGEAEQIGISFFVPDPVFFIIRPALLDGFSADKGNGWHRRTPPGADFFQYNIFFIRDKDFC